MKIRVYKNDVGGAVYKIEDKYYSFMHKPPKNEADFHKEWDDQQAQFLFSNQFVPVNNVENWVKDFVCELEL